MCTKERDDKNLPPYNLVRLFYYSLKRKHIVEFDSKGNQINSLKYSDIGELKEFL
ncbi:hypothetical protein HY483_04520 [Candidatus Woesearchaeota archaeon]|nr:hypothetical protein [Candidatus Woesearchaeota archaeon]